MRKRSKKRISQEISPWIRANIYNGEEAKLTILNKRTTRWKSGVARDWQTALYNEQIKNGFANFLLKTFKKISSIKNKKQNRRFQMRWYFLLKMLFLNKKQALSKPKNFCLIIGKQSTYNRKVYISRQTFRKFMRLNCLIGIKKT